MATFTFHFGSRGQNRPMGKGGRIFLALFFSVFLGMGLLATAALASSTWEDFQPYKWTKTPCTVVASASERGRDEEGLYVFWVEYRYEAGGREYTSHRHRMADQGYSDYTKVQHLLNDYAPGVRATCYVNPADPSQSVLTLESPASALVVLFPLIFVAVGAGGMYFALRGLFRKRDPLAPTAPSLSQQAAGNWGGAGMALFFSLFLAAGLGMLYPLGLRPILQAAGARDWRETSCTIVSSEVRSHQGDDSTTYSVEILYEYEAGGRTCRSNRYDFVPGSSGGYDAKAAIVERHPPGSHAVCYVDPGDPAEAVMDRSIGWGALLLLFPLLFVAVGGGGIIFSVRSVLRKRARVKETPTEAAAPARFVYRSGPRSLKPSATPALKFLGFLLMAAFWNGITWVFVWQAILGWRKGHPDIFLTLFISIFVLAGLGMIGGVAYFFLAMFNPRLHLTLPGDEIRLGEPADLEWSLSGGVRKVSSLAISLEGREEAVYRSGKNTHTSKDVFHFEELVRTNPSDVGFSGRCRVAPPAGAMHSFKAEHNRVVWALKVEGEIPSWPDLKEEFALEVLPGRLEEKG